MHNSMDFTHLLFFTTQIQRTCVSMLVRIIYQRPRTRDDAAGGRGSRIIIDPFGPSPRSFSNKNRRNESRVEPESYTCDLQQRSDDKFRATKTPARERFVQIAALSLFYASARALVLRKIKEFEM